MAVNRVLSSLLLVLLLLCGLPDRAEAFSTPPEKTASGSLSQNPDKRTYVDPLMVLELQRDRELWGYDLGLGVDVGPNLYAYVRQNPWTHFDPLGLEIAGGADMRSNFQGSTIAGLNYTPPPSVLTSAKAALVRSTLYLKNIVKSLRAEIGAGLGLSVKPKVGPVKVNVGVDASYTSKMKISNTDEYSVKFSANAGASATIAGTVAVGAAKGGNVIIGSDGEGNSISEENPTSVFGVKKLKKGNSAIGSNGEFGISGTLGIVSGGASIDLVEGVSVGQEEYKATQAYKDFSRESANNFNRANPPQQSERQSSSSKIEKENEDESE